MLKTFTLVKLVINSCFFSSLIQHQHWFLSSFFPLLLFSRHFFLDFCASYLFCSLSICIFWMASFLFMTLNIPNADDSHMCVFTLDLVFELQIFMLIISLTSYPVCQTYVDNKSLHYLQCQKLLSAVFPSQEMVLILPAAHAPNLGTFLTSSHHSHSISNLPAYPVGSSLKYRPKNITTSCYLYHQQFGPDHHCQLWQKPSKSLMSFPVWLIVCKAVRIITSKHRLDYATLLPKTPAWYSSKYHFALSRIPRPYHA